jgi:site-specific DNA-adenine methylase
MIREKMNFKNHKEFQKTLVEQAARLRIHLIIMDGVFDLVLDSKTPKIIELKIIRDNFRISVGDNYGFEFDENQTRELRRINNKELIPFVIACDRKIKNEKRFYFVTREKIRKAMHVASRDEYNKIIFNRVERNHLFKKRVAWGEVLQKLRELSEY